MRQAFLAVIDRPLNHAENIREILSIRFDGFKRDLRERFPNNAVSALDFSDYLGAVLEGYIPLLVERTLTPEMLARALAHMSTEDHARVLVLHDKIASQGTE